MNTRKGINRIIGITIWGVVCLAGAMVVYYSCKDAYGESDAWSGRFLRGIMSRSVEDTLECFIVGFFLPLFVYFGLLAHFDVREDIFEEDEYTKIAFFVSLAISAVCGLSLAELTGDIRPVFGSVILITPILWGFYCVVRWIIEGFRSPE
jgi:hypothetical protein